MIRGTRGAFASLVACAACVTAQDPVGPQVASVSIDGVEDLDADALLEGLETRAPEGWIDRTTTPFDPLAVERDRERIAARYHAHGFFEPSVEVTVSRQTDEDVEVEFVVREGPRARIESVRIVGLPRDLEATVSRWPGDTEVETGAPFAHAAYLELKSRIERELPRRGYPFATVRGRALVDRERGAVAVEIAVESGPRARFGATSIAGNQREPTSLIDNRVAWTAGEPFDTELIELTHKRLYETGRFGLVDVDARPGSEPELAEMTVVVDEARPRELRLGVGLGVDRVRYEVRARGSYVQHGFIAPLYTLRLRARPAYVWLRADDGESGPAVEATATIERDDFILPRLRWSNTVGYSIVEHLAYSLQGPDYGTRLDWALLRDRLRLGVGWGFRVGTFLRVEEVISDQERQRVGLESPYRLGYLWQSLIYDRRDSPLDTRSGVYMELSAEQSAPIVAGDFSYLRLTTEGRGYLSVGPRLVLAARVRFGTSQTERGKLPITQRFFAGGANSQRGFSQQTLAPGAAADPSLPLGGEVLFESNLEARVDIVQLLGSWLAVVGFADGADAPLKTRQLMLSNLHWAAGGGLRYRSPVGVVRFDLGFRLNRRGPNDPQPDSGWAFHLSLGEAF